MPCEIDRPRMLLVTMCLALSLGAIACQRRTEPPAQSEPSTRRAIQSGELVGFRSPYGSDAWYGIPYARPPIGELRWRAPEPPAAWSGVRPALSHGAVCTQYASALGGGAEGKPGQPGGSEDCLYLSLWAPHAADGKAAGLPVMVWIHGGGNTIGHGGFYDGGNLAASENVVVVAINYRLGPFGWFRHPSLQAAAASEDERSGNFGTLDIIRSLAWVRQNIAAFGGDPNNVTIFGESAGGANVYTMLLSPKANGYFHRAAVQSGGLNFDSVEAAELFTEDGGHKNSSNELLVLLLIQDGKAKDRAGAKQALAAMSPAAIAAYLRGVSNLKLLGAYDGGGLGMIDMPRLFADGVVLPTGDPLELLARPDGYNVVPVMAGTNKDENKLFMFGDSENVRRILWIVPRLRDERMYNLRAEYLARMWKATGADEPAAAMRKTQPNVFVYRFDWDEEPRMLGADLGVMLGAAHLFEVPFVFGHFDLGEQGKVLFNADNEPGRQQLSGDMMSYWAEFARSGKPGSGGKKNLKEWTAAPAYMILDTPAGGGLRMADETVTTEAVVASVSTDPRLANAADRCAVLRDLASWSRGFDREQYAAIEECKAYPPA